jgi:uncharacterized membrane protein
MINFQLRQGNATAIITAMIFIVIIMISWFVMMRPFAIIYDVYYDEASAEAQGIMQLARQYWLLTPVIMIVGLIIWIITVATRRDPQTYQL